MRCRFLRFAALPRPEVKIFHQINWKELLAQVIVCRVWRNEKDPLRKRMDLTMNVEHARLDPF